ncbi:MAG: transcription antitermination factor NusB [Deltaproteobacteria bacterium]|nr:transcription antitermination factor NusB [Deltaproteobacteria bacterium]
MGKRRKARELAIQVLFHLEFSPGDPDEVFDLICEVFNPLKKIRAFSKALVLGVCKNKPYLDELIQQASTNWRLERMARVDRCILRLGVFEIVFAKDIPPKVSIDESVELGKIFGTDDSGAFINGILDNIYNQLEKEDRFQKNHL